MVLTIVPMLRTRLTAAAVAVGALSLLAGLLGTTDVASATTAAVSGTAARSGPAWGRSFGIDRRSDAPNGITQVSCPSTTFCAAVDGSGRALVFKGTKWSPARAIDADPSGFSGLSCPTTTFCIATDTDGFAVTWNGKRWSAPKQIDPTQDQGELQLFVSCATRSFCGAVDSFGEALTWHGHGWARHLVTDQYGNGVDFSGLSCPTKSFCVAVDGNGDAVTWDGAKWSKPRLIDDLGNLNVVSCSSPKFCAAAGSGVLIFNGKKWLPAESISSVQMKSVSCVSPRWCMAGDFDGAAYRWNGARWSDGRAITEGDTLNSISCPTSSFCAAVTSGGNVVFYAPVPAVATASLRAATKGRAYSVQLRARGGVAPYTWRTVRGLPHGLKLSSSGMISGTPKTAGKFLIKVAVSDPLHETSNRKLSLKVEK
jgi:hypothetical protein